ncbi:MAG TPA: family 16 glycoside hydrolase [Bellilinea sp.]|nr:family 16 glycoside hydrolase [Bellilinea sp.]
MKKTALAILLIIFAASGCNLPYSSPTEPTPDIVASQVATMLTQPPTPSGVIDTPAVILPTAEATATPLPTATPQPTATATISPEDPRVQLGNPDFTDTLDSGRSFGLDSQAYDDDYTSIRVENGALILTSRYATGFRGWRTGGTKLGNAYLEAKVHVAECSKNDMYGLVFRSPDFIKGYWFQVTCDGSWSLGYWDGDDYTSLGDGANPGGALLTGSNQTNRLGVWTSGSQIKLYINGKLVTEVDDSSQTEPGSYGAVIASFNTQNLTVSIDEFAYWKFD